MDHWVYKDSEALHIWLHILLSATHDYYTTIVNGRLVELYPGQLIFGRLEWAKELKIKENKIRSTIKLFKETEMISVYPTNKYSIITVCNWSSYQRFFENDEGEHQNAQQHDQQNIHQNNQQNILKNTHLQRIGDRQNNQQNNHTDNQQRTTNKNVKNDKKKEDIYTDIFNHWLSKNIISHRKLTSKMKTKINSALKEYDIDSIKAAIDTYAEIVLNDKYWFTHKWSLDDFLQRGISKFENRDIAISNYMKEDFKIKKLEKQNYDPYSNARIFK